MAVAERILNLRPLADNRPDRALIAEAQRGNAQASAVLIERYYPRIYSFVSHLTYGRANTEDLTQEVFARALKALGRFNGRYPFEYWLLRIAKNLCIDEARRSSHSAELTDPGELVELEGIPAPDYVWETVSRELVASVVHRALGSLPPRHRAVLVMREMEGMSYADIAQVIGTNPRGVEATLRRARLRFRMEIARAESAEEGRATCRRVLRFVSDNPGSRSEEAAAHLAECAECRRAARGAGSRVAVPARGAFGVIPLFGLVKGLLKGMPGARTVSVRGSSALASVRRVTERMRDSSAAAGLATTAALTAPLVRVAEVTAGVVMVSVVAVAPALPAFQSSAAAVTAAAPSATPDTLQVASVASFAELYKASTTSPLYSASTSPALSTSAAPVASMLETPPAALPGLLGDLGLAQGQNVVATAVGNTAAVTNILADQVEQVSQLADSAASQIDASTGGVIAPVTSAVTQTVTAVTGGLSEVIGSVGTGVKNTGAKLSVKP